jgi:hypothetical protein
MKVEEVKEYYKTGWRFHKATGMSPVNFINWERWGYIPIVSQHKIEADTQGKLKANWEDAQ